MAPLTLDLLQKALTLHRRGAVAEAAVIYAEVQRADPHNADAPFYLATIACQQGRFAEGTALARKALSERPTARPRLCAAGACARGTRAKGGRPREL